MTNPSPLENDSNDILWTKNNKITWDDFEGTPELSSETMARTYSSMYCDWKEEIFKNDTKYKFRIIEIEVKAVFGKSKSWKTEQIFQQGEDRAKYFLNHEQGHFDLTEESARKLRKKLSILNKKSYLCKGKNNEQRKEFAKKEAKKIVGKIYDSEYTKLDKLQKKYDSDTNHGWIEDRQRVWDERFAQLRQ